MTISGPTRLLATAVATVALAGATTDPALARTPATAARAGDAGYGAPRVGACSTMTPAQADAASDHSPRVSCSTAHTARVVGVVRLPSRLRWATASHQDLYRVVAASCLPLGYAVLGRDFRARDSSAYAFVWFEPTKAQRRHGARWLSCSVVLRQAAKLAHLPTNRTPMLRSGRLPDGVSRCLTKAVATTRCSASHVWRSSGTFVVSSDRYPGRAALDGRATRQCASRVLAGRTYRWTYRDKITWQRAGDHVVVCYSHTSK